MRTSQFEVETVKPSGAYRISTVSEKLNRRLTMVYFFFTKDEAIEAFKEYVNTQEESCK